MRAPAKPVSDYDLVRKMLGRVAQIEQTRRLMPNETRLIYAVRERWTNDGEAFALTPDHRKNLLALVRKIEARLKAPVYAPFC